MDTNVGFLNKLNASVFRRLLEEAESIPGHSPLFVFDNHDRPRSWDRYGDGVHNQQIAKMLATILLCSRSASLIYQGEELGMQTMTPTRKEDVRDPRRWAGWPKEKGRDGERTPMQWSPAAGAGFTTSPKPWLPIEPSFMTKNVQTEQRSANSLLPWYSSLLGLRRERPALASGKMLLLSHDEQGVPAWLRLGSDNVSSSEAYLILNNMSPSPVVVDIASDLHKAHVTASALNSVLCSFACKSSIHATSVTLPAYGSFLGLLRILKPVEQTPFVPEKALGALSSGTSP